MVSLVMRPAVYSRMPGRSSLRALEGRISGFWLHRGRRRQLRTASCAATPEVDVLVVGGGHAGQLKLYTRSSTFVLSMNDAGTAGFTLYRAWAPTKSTVQAFSGKGITQPHIGLSSVMLMEL